MKNNKMLKALAVICAVILFAAAGMQFAPFAYAEQYHVGDAEISAVPKNLEINWTSGTVHIAYHSKGTVIISEKTSGAISENMRMRWRMEGDTLRIEFNEPGFHLFSFSTQKKELTVTLPKGHTLEKANIHTTSGDQDIPALYADSVKLESTSGDIRAVVHARTVKGEMTSGDIELQVMSEAEEIRIGSTSGDIVLETAFPAEKIKISSTSGSIRAAVKESGEFKAGSTSGAIHAVLGSAKKAELESTSGKATVEIDCMETLKISTTSGGVNAYLPAAPGFTAKIGTVSGRIEQQLPMTKQGKTYVSGDGSGSVEIKTTSGNITISAKEKGE